MHEAAQHGSCKVAKLLLDAQSDQVLQGEGAGIDAQDSQGLTPLALAASEQQWDAVVLLLNAAAAVELSDSEGNTVLHIATHKLPTNWSKEIA